MVQFIAQAYWFPKDPQAPTEWEDAVAYSERTFRCAVADGASGSYESGAWAHALTSAYIEDFPPAYGQVGATRLDVVRTWFTAQAEHWNERRPAATQWWERDAEAAKPAAAAFAGLQFASRPDGQLGWEVTSIGDCCLFHIRRRKLELSFPLTSAAEFNSRPHLMTSAAGRLAGALEHVTVETGLAEPEDLFVLATDAASECLLNHRQLPETWAQVGFFGAQNFSALVTDLRDAGAMAVDDVAVVAVTLDP